MNGLEEDLAILRKQYDEARLALLDKYSGKGVQLPLAVPKTRPTERPPESPQQGRRKFTVEEIEQALAKVIETIRAEGPLGREKLRKNLSMEEKLLSKALTLGQESDQLSIVGERRASKYVIPSAGQRAGRVKKR